MNKLEKQMVSILEDLKANYSVTGVKAEFEAEGTRMEEAMRLKEVSMCAGLGMTLKIGGCEAIKDMFEAGSLGVKHLVAPMVETAYALKKYLGAVDIAFSKEDQEDVDFLINLETITAVGNFDAMLELPAIRGLRGVVVGRVDLTGSMGLDRSSVNGDQILAITKEVATKCKAHGLEMVVGGAVSVHSMPFFQALPYITRFETRKVVFSCPGALQNPEAAFLKAVEFELLWLKNKKNYYGAIHREDDIRLVMMEERYRRSIEAISDRTDGSKT